MAQLTSCQVVGFTNRGRLVVLPNTISMRPITCAPQHVQDVKAKYAIGTGENPDASGKNATVDELVEKFPSAWRGTLSRRCAVCLLVVFAFVLARTGHTRVVPRRRV